MRKVTECQIRTGQGAERRQGRSEQEARATERGGVSLAQSLRGSCAFPQAGLRGPPEEHREGRVAHPCCTVSAPASTACVKPKNPQWLPWVAVYLFKSLLLLHSSNVPSLWFALENAC